MAAKWWKSPFLRQLFVTAGISLNIGQFGVVAGYVLAIVPQLEKSGSPIPMDDNSASWFASIHGLSLFIGYATVANIISKFGRKNGSIISSTLVLSGWICILLAENLATLLIGRFLQGIGIGLCLTLGPIYIAECTSPKNRGFCLASTAMCMSVGSAIIHYLGSILHWRDSALICTVVAFLDLLICLNSPETPSFLASTGKFEDCKNVYLWLRGRDDEELSKLIQVATDAKSKSAPKCNSIQSKCRYLLSTVKNKEVYKSVLIGIHLLSICYWCGSPTFSSYPITLIHTIVGRDVNTPILILTLDINRIVNSILALYVIRKFKRKAMLFSTVGLTITCCFVIAGYVYAKDNGFIYNMPLLSISLLHIHMFSISIGAFSLPVIIAGEIYPMKYRGVAASLTRLTSCIHVFLVYKTFPDILKSVNIYGCYSIFGVVCSYALIVCYFYMPETKDRTLQDIEDELKGCAVKESDTNEPLI